MKQAGEGHLHLWLDSDVSNPNAAIKQINQEPVVFDRVKAGEHRLAVQLVGANHKPILPEVKQVVHFKTTSVQASSPAKPLTPQVKPGKTYTINLSNYAFTPNNLSVEGGSTVTFINADDVEHTVTAKDGSFDSGSVGKGKSFAKTFDKAGVYNIYCKPHKFMVGTIIVK